MAWAILDTSIYIGHWERGLYGDVLDAVRRAFVVRHSSVVLSELRRGARTPEARRHGTTVVTANRSDFELLAQALRFPILPA